MKEPKDKRTKEYKDWKASQENESKGLGDTIAKITKATGIDKAVKFLAGEDCGCEERKEKLNELFPYNKPMCLNEQEYNVLKSFFERDSNIVTIEDQKSLIPVSNRIFREVKNTTSCGSCVRGLVDRLRAVYNEYEKK